MDKADVDVREAALAACISVATIQLPNPAARILVWLVGVAAYQGSFPVSLSYGRIRNGLTVNGNKIAGTMCHFDTIRDSLALLKQLGLITFVPNPDNDKSDSLHIVVCP